MNRLLFLGVLAAGALLADGAVAQQNDADPNAGNGVKLQNMTQLALGSLIAGPYDVETGPFDNRCLGVEEMGGYIFVSGGGHTTIGWAYKIHRYDMNGTYIDSFPQVSNAASWGARDMQAVPAAGGYTLYCGSDNAEVSEYFWNGSTLTHVALHTVPGVVGTVRALCQRPSDGHFFTKSFTSSHYEFTLTGLVNTVANAALSAYGYGWDDTNASIWSTTSGPSVQEIDAACVYKAGAFGPTWGTAQGGADVYCDSRNPGMLSMLILGQGTPDSVEVYDLAVAGSCGPPAFTLAKSGTCPGPVTLTTTNGAPGGSVAYLSGGPGSTTKPSGACAGTTVSLSSPTLRAIRPSNGSGSSSLSFNAPAGACGATMQCVDIGPGPCTTSNTITL
jgi:hypothetical protein